MSGDDALVVSHALTLITGVLLPFAIVGAGYIWALWWNHPSPRPKFWFMTSVVVTVVLGVAIYLFIVGVSRYLGVPTEWLPLGRAIVALLLVLSVCWTARYVRDTRRQR